MTIKEMTIKEAIEEIKAAPEWSKGSYEAKCMAIEGLEKLSDYEQIKWERDTAFEALKESNTGFYEHLLKDLRKRRNS